MSFVNVCVFSKDVNANSLCIIIHTYVCACVCVCVCVCIYVSESLPCRDGTDAQNMNRRCAEHEKLPNSPSRKF